jgi:hypothetical protein
MFFVACFICLDVQRSTFNSRDSDSTNKICIINNCNYCLRDAQNVDQTSQTPATLCMSDTRESYVQPMETNLCDRSGRQGIASTSDTSFGGRKQVSQSLHSRTSLYIYHIAQ